MKKLIMLSMVALMSAFSFASDNTDTLLKSSDQIYEALIKYKIQVIEWDLVQFNPGLGDLYLGDADGNAYREITTVVYETTGCYTTSQLQNKINELKGIYGTHRIRIMHTNLGYCSVGELPIKFP